MSIKGLWSVRLIHPYFFGPPLYSVVALGNKLLVEETIEKMDLRPRERQTEMECRSERQQKTWKPLTRLITALHRTTGDRFRAINTPRY